MALCLIRDNIGLIDDRVALCRAFEKGEKAYAVDSPRNAEGTPVDFRFGVIRKDWCGPARANDSVVDVLAGIFER